MSSLSTKSPVPTGTAFSLVIPWAETWHTDELVREKFGELEWGVVTQVDIVSRSGHGKRDHAKVFIHFSSWTEEIGVKDHLSEGKELKVWHSETHFWKVRASSWKFKEREVVSGGGGEKSKPKVEFC